MERIVQHKHCVMCGKAVPPNEKFCNKECETSFNQIARKRKYMVYLMYGMVIVFVLLAFFSMR